MLDLVALVLFPLRESLYQEMPNEIIDEIIISMSYPICQSFKRDFFRICLQLASLPGNVAVYNTSLYLTDMENNDIWLDDDERTLTQKLEKEKAYL